MSKPWIKLEVPFMHGPAIVRWQEMCVLAGFETDPDGVFGPDTDHVTKEAQTWLGVKVDGIVGPKTLDAMQAKLDAKDSTDPALTVVDGVEVYDYRGKVAKPKNGVKIRPWNEISGVVLHRTACVLGEKPQRYFPVNCHIGVTMGGRVVLSHPFDLMIWHGHYPSRWTIGIEFDGNPTGRPGYWWKPGGGPHPITDEQVKAGNVLLDILTKAFEDNGRTLKYIYAHRQSSDQRECDPGNECWQKIALPWMEKTGATPGDIGRQGSTFGTGYCIPQSWDPKSPVKGFRVRNS